MSRATKLRWQDGDPHGWGSSREFGARREEAVARKRRARGGDLEYRLLSSILKGNQRMRHLLSFLAL